MLRVLVLAVMIAAQWAIPAWMLIDRELTLRDGVVFRFHTQQFDPVDFFRGRYVALSIPILYGPGLEGEPLEYGQPLYAHLEADAEGFARVKAVSVEPPADDTPYFKTEYTSQWTPEGEVGVPVVIPFDRYYMEESLAPEAEAAYREATRTAQSRSYVTARVRAGKMVLDELFIDDMPISEYLAQRGM